MTGQEIGTLKVLGCEKRELMAMILLEAGIYGLVGGACGVVLSLLFGKIINRIAVSALLLEAGTKIAVITPKLALSAVGMAMPLEQLQVIFHHDGRQSFHRLQRCGEIDK